MSATVLEAKAIIRGVDEVTPVLEAIARKMDGVLAKAKTMSRVTETAERAMASTNSAIERAGAAMAAAAGNMEGAARAMERAAVATSRAGRSRGSGGGGGHGHGWGRVFEERDPERGVHHALKAAGSTMPIVGGYGTAIAAAVAGDAAIKIVTANAERQHERVREDNAGMNPAERAEAEKYAAVLAARYTSVDQTSVMHLLRNARSTTGSYEDAAMVADELIKTRIVAMAAKPGRDIEGEMDLLIKAMESWGKTQDVTDFRRVSRMTQKILAVEGDTMSPEDIYQYFKYSRQALAGTSERFMMAAAPGVAQEMKGNSFGTALSSFNRNIVLGKMDGEALRTAVHLDLIDKADVDLDKDGKPVRVKSLMDGGHGFHNWQTAAADPDKYIYDTLAKALDEHGIKDPHERDQVANTLLSNRMGGYFVDTFLNQRARIEKNERNLANAPDDPAARIMAGDPIAGWQGVKNSFDNLAAAIPVSGSAVTGALNAIAAAMNDEAGRLQGVQTDHARLVENQDKYGIAIGRDLSKLPPDEFAKAKAAALADDRLRLLAKRLELTGVLDENTKIAKMGWGEYLTSGRDKLDDAALPFRAKNLQTEIADLEAQVARLRALRQTGSDDAAAVSGNLQARAVQAAKGSPYGALGIGPIEAVVKPDQITAKATFDGQIGVRITAPPGFGVTATTTSEHLKLDNGGSMPGAAVGARYGVGR